ncbi:hypothetical protein [Luteococcus sp.]|uniref:hypothetical protein n=1 Tax=Luteococcus sp. TaxID=1969402 RepID=UPI003736B05B
MLLLTTTDAQPPEHLVAAAAAGLLDISPAGIAKLAAAGILEPDRSRFRRVDVEALAALPQLRVTGGEILVLRLDGGDPSTGGVHLDMTDQELTAAALQGWRGDVQRMTACPLLVVTVATIPIAVFRITGLAGTTPAASRTVANRERHRLDGVLLGRRGQEVVAGEAEERAWVELVLGSRVVSRSAGPVAYVGGSGEQGGGEEAEGDAGAEGEATVDVAVLGDGSQGV